LRVGEHIVELIAHCVIGRAVCVADGDAERLIRTRDGALVDRDLLRARAARKLGQLRLRGREAAVACCTAAAVCCTAAFNCAESRSASTVPADTWLPSLTSTCAICPPSWNDITALFSASTLPGSSTDWTTFPFATVTAPNVGGVAVLIYQYAPPAAASNTTTPTAI